MNSLALLVIVLGLAVGSFLNVCIYRLPREMSAACPPSYCPNCGQALQIKDLVPLFSYLFLKGRYRCCGAKISLRHPLVELFTAAAFLVFYFCFGWTSQFLTNAVFFSGLLVCSLIDIDYQIIPNKVISVMLVLGIPLLAVQSTEILLRGLVGGTVGFLLLFAVAFFSRGGMGGGDVKLAAVLGLYLGWPNILLALMLSFVIGSAAALLLIAQQKKTVKAAVAFGPFLSSAALITALWGDRIINWYLQVFLY